MKTSFVCACALFCLWVGLAAAQPATLIPPITNICGLEGYDLVTLQHAGFWEFTVEDKTQCIIPRDNTTADVQSCTIFFSVCHPIEDKNLCPGENSSICQEVVLNDGTRIYYNLGTYDPSHKYSVSADGFVANRNGSTVSVNGCDKELNAQISFICDSNAVWNLQSTNITNYLKLFMRNPTDGCELIAEVAYKGACYIAPTLGPNTCQLDDYNVHTLAERDYWYASVSKSYCFDSSNIDTCKFYFSFCHPVPPEVNGKCYENGVCQIGERGSSRQVYGMGLFTNLTRFIPNAGDVAGGFHVDYENGTAPSCTHQNGTRTQIVLSCNSSVNWTQPDQTNNIRVVKTSQCAYTLELQYNGACESEYPTAAEETSVIGWIFIAVFFGLVAIYLVGGSAYRYFGKQERGLRILPNYDFWKGFVLAVLEGCKFCLDLVTCSKFVSSGAKVKYDNI